MGVFSLPLPQAGPARALRPAAAQGTHFLALTLQIRRHLLQHVFEHGQRVQRRTAGERPVGFRLLPAGAHVRVEFLLELGVALLRPLAERDQMRLEARDRVPERPGTPLFLRPVTGGIVAGGVRGRPVGHVLDERRTPALPGTLCGPLGDRVDGEEIVAIDADAGNAVARSGLRESALLAAGKALERGDGPLVVDEVQDHRRAVHLRESHRVVEIRLGARALPDPARGDAVLALDGRRHGPADRLRILGGQVAGDREDVAARPVVHDGHLPPLAHVAGVREALTHEVDQVAAPHDLQALLPVGRKQHVPGRKRHAGRHRHRLLARGLDVKGDAPLALDLLHPVVEQPHEQHVPQTHLQLLGLQVRVPRADRAVILVQDAHHLHRQVLDVARRGLDVRTLHGARPGISARS